jgi:hypothetical protein
MSSPSSIVFLLLGLLGTTSADSCGFTLTSDNTLVADEHVKAICLGPCPPDADGAGLYVADGYEVRFGDNMYVTKDTSNGEVRWYTRDVHTLVETRILTCYNSACVLGDAVPADLVQYTPGTYMAGNAASGTRGAWQIHSTMHMLGEGDALMHRVSAISNSSIQGWAVDVPPDVWYVMTTIGLMVVGPNVGQDQILNAAQTGGIGVLAEKDIFVTQAPGNKKNVGTITLPVLGQPNIVRQSVYVGGSSNCGAYSMRDLVVTTEVYKDTDCFSTTGLPFAVDLCDADCAYCYSHFRLESCTPGSDRLQITLFKSLSECTGGLVPPGVPKHIFLGSCKKIVNATDTYAMLQCFNTL